MANQEWLALGQVDVLDGTLVIIDPGLGRFWRHDADPSSPRRSDPREYDLVIEGPDAAAAGKAYDREFTPTYLFDHPEPESGVAKFNEFAREGGFDASATILNERVPHTERSRLAIEAGGGIGVVSYNRRWGVAVATPRSQATVVGMPLSEGDFAGRWEFVDVVFDENVETVRESEVQGVMVDHGQLMFSGLNALGKFQAGQSLDGLADYVFWGRDAEALASKLGATKLDDEFFGWVNVPMDSIGEHASAAQDVIAEKRLKVGVDYRPHCNLERANAMMRESEEDTSELSLDGSRVVACGNRWGDGIFSVTAMYGSGDVLARVRVKLGTEAHQSRMRQVWIRSQAAIVSKAILEGGEPIRFGERMEPNNPRDSGWCFFAGTESDEYINNPDNSAIVNVGSLVQEHPAIGSILDSPIGALVKREGDEFVPDEG